MNSKLPDSMKTIEVPNPGGTEVLEVGTRPVPEPKSGEVLIRTAGAGVNRADIMQRSGNYPPPPGASDILGLEVSGTVVATGSDVDTPSVGDEVCALIAGGGYAEYCVAPAVTCLPIPEGTDLVIAGGIPETFFTVWTNVYTSGRLASGETLLVHGGSSGIGTTAIQIAKANHSKVFATAGTDAKCKQCEELGADFAINYKTQDFVQEVQNATSGKGVDVVLDIVGGDYVARNLKCLGHRGRLVIIATQRGIKAEINILPIMLKQLTVTGSTLRARPNVAKQVIADSLREHVWPLLENGTVKPVIDSVLPYGQVQDAHRHLDSGTHFGKIILQFSE